MSCTGSKERSPAIRSSRWCWAPTARWRGLILVRFVERDAPPNGAVILGFMEPDLAALFERAVAAGGTVHAEIRDPKIPGVALVGFLADPDGHLAEVLQPAAADA